MLTFLSEIHSLDNERGVEFKVTTHDVLECSHERQKSLENVPRGSKM